MTRIHLAGPFVWLWGAWHLVWLAAPWLVWPLWGTDALVATWYGIYAAFLPLEIVGAARNARQGDGRARTLSQWRQWLAERAPGDRPGWLDDVTSWRALAGGTGIYDALVSALLVGAAAVAAFSDVAGPTVGAPAGVLVGVAWGLTVAAWLVPHFGWHRWNG